MTKSPFLPLPIALIATQNYYNFYYILNMADKSMANSQTKKAIAASKLLADKRINHFKVFDDGDVRC